MCQMPGWEGARAEALICSSKAQEAPPRAPRVAGVPQVAGCPPASPPLTRCFCCPRSEGRASRRVSPASDKGGHPGSGASQGWASAAQLPPARPPSASALPPRVLGENRSPRLFSPVCPRAPSHFLDSRQTQELLLSFASEAPLNSPGGLLSPPLKPAHLRGTLGQQGLCQRNPISVPSSQCPLWAPAALIPNISAVIMLVTWSPDDHARFLASGGHGSSDSPALNTGLGPSCASCHLLNGRMSHATSSSAPRGTEGRQKAQAGGVPRPFPPPLIMWLGQQHT